MLAQLKGPFLSLVDKLWLLVFNLGTNATSDSITELVAHQQILIAFLMGGGCRVIGQLSSEFLVIDELCEKTD